MVDREKVTRGMELCAYDPDPGQELKEIRSCPECPYYRAGCSPQLIRDALAMLNEQEHITGETSDGYHTFNELYHHRAVLFSVIVANYPDRAWKSKKHHDGTMYDNMFIVGIDTPDGQATYHYDVDPYWDMFKCRVLDNAPEWDGHTPAQAIERIGKLKAREPRVMTLEELWDVGRVWESSVPPYLWLEKNRSIYNTTSFWVAWRDIYEMIHGRHDKYTEENYGSAWRVWTLQPTPEQMRDTKWEEENDAE